MFDHHLVKRLVIAPGNESPGLGLVEGAHFLDQTKESSAAVLQMTEPVFHFGGAKWMDIETDVFAVAPVFIPFEHADLVKGAAQISAPERFVLVEFQPILVIEVK